MQRFILALITAVLLTVPHFARAHYDPVAGRFLSGDPLGHAASQDLYSFCGGDPVNRFDPDGRCINGAGSAANGFLQSMGNLAVNAYFSMSYGVSVLASGTDQANQWYGQYWQGLKQSVTGAAQSLYDVAAAASYGLVSPFAPDAAYNAYGPSMERLQQASRTLSGGNYASPAYRIGYGGFNVATMLLGGEVGEAERVGELGEIVDSGRAADIVQAAEGTALRSNADLVQEVATRAEAWGARQGLPAAGGGPVQGTLKHDYAARLLDRYQSMYGNRGLVTEGSWLGGAPVNYGTRGSVRLDVFDTTSGMVYDYKFTLNPSLSPARVQQIINNGPAGITGVLPIGP